MTPKEQAAMQQALDALEVHQPDPEQQMVTGAIIALREALAEPVGQEPFDMDDHPPHRLCECRKCMEYFTPLPDCDAFAASGKPIAEQEPVAWIELLREARDNCKASIVEEGISATRKEYRIDLEARLSAALNTAPVQQAEKEPVGEVVMESMGVGDAQIVRFRMNGRIPPVGTKLYAAPIRTKDLTDDEIVTLAGFMRGGTMAEFARAVIAADREKNRG